MDAINKINEQKSAKTNVKIPSVDEIYGRVELIKQSIPPVTSTESEKRKVIIAKENILDLIYQALRIAESTNNSELVSNINKEISIIKNEIQTIKIELDSMTSVFDKKNYDDNQKEINYSPNQNDSIFS